MGCFSSVGELGWQVLCEEKRRRLRVSPEVWQLVKGYDLVEVCGKPALLVDGKPYMLVEFLVPGRNHTEVGHVNRDCWDCTRENLYWGTYPVLLRG